ncbi:MAG: hypothetical protein DME26_08080, partial [Verrucomicrobia bacterium]
NWKSLVPGAGGVVMALYVFMADALQTADQGVEALRTMLPVWFNWPLFSVALGLMSAPILEVGRQAWCYAADELETSVKATGSKS